jgi:hypothetical protein
MSRTMSRSICDNLEKDCLANAAPKSESQREPKAKRSLFADLEHSEPDDRPVDRPVDGPTLLMFNTLKTL